MLDIAVYFRCALSRIYWRLCTAVTR